MSADSELISRHLQGDQEASRALIEKYQDLVYGLVRQLLGDGEDAEDAAQEIFLRVFDALPKFRGDSAFSTWLYRVAVNGCMARSKKRRRRLAVEAPKAAVQDLAGAAPSSLEAMERRERDERLHQAVARLAEPYRLVITLHYFQGLGYEEVAQVLAVPVGTVKARLFRAKEKLQRSLRRRRAQEGGLDEVE